MPGYESPACLFYYALYTLLQKNSPDITRATQGIQPSKYCHLHPPAFTKLMQQLFGITTVPKTN